MTEATRRCLKYKTIRLLGIGTVSVPSQEEAVAFCRKDDVDTDARETIINWVDEGKKWRRQWSIANSRRPVAERKKAARRMKVQLARITPSVRPVH